MKSIEDQMKIIMKGVEDIICEDELKEKLTKSIQRKRPLNIKLGLDPSAPDIHLGHAVVLRKIKQMQDLGHRVIIIIGDFTGKIGDPTGKSKTRKPLTNNEVLKNAKTYESQIFKILDKNKTEVKFNSQWLSKLTFENVIKISSATTVARMLERDNFKKRYNNNVPIGVHEFFYPLMQGYDSVALDADIELGGTDQTFNILMGRTLQKSMGKKEQVAMFMPILEGLDGIEKMSKSLGNYIGINEEAQVMFKKVMEVPDNLIIRYFELATDEHPERIDQFKNELSNGKNPRDVKLILAEIITSLYHTAEETTYAKDYFHTVFNKGEIPDNVPEIVIPANCKELIDIIPILAAHKYVASNSEFRRLVNQGGICLNGERLNTFEDILIKDCDVLKIEKKIFVRLKNCGA